MVATIRRVGVKGEIAQERGLPKPSVPQALVTVRGLDGDYNRYRQEELHGDPDSAVLLIAEETLRELQQEGWPVAPGDLGENFTLGGLDPSLFTPGLRLGMGAAEVQVSRRCDPCRNLFALPYIGDARGPEFLRATLVRRGWYARVLREGVVRVGDLVRANQIADRRPVDPAGTTSR
ncbi:MAG: MOSC domain-containing protein [Thermoplasmata archaeon]|nr:MOSC domain-containing protein [Thermoplasmata archaeon]